MSESGLAARMGVRMYRNNPGRFTWYAMRCIDRDLEAGKVTSEELGVTESELKDMRHTAGKHECLFWLKLDSEQPQGTHIGEVMSKAGVTAEDLGYTQEQIDNHVREARIADVEIRLTLWRGGHGLPLGIRAVVAELGAPHTELGITNEEWEQISADTDTQLSL